MKSKLTNYLIIIILGGCFGFNDSNIFVVAQEPDSLPGESKAFGYSLKNPAKKKKEKAKIEPQNNPIVTQNNPANDDGIIRIETALVTNEVLVFDQNKNPVKYLKKEDFIVREDNESQDISTFISGDSELIPRSIVLIIDYSFSQLPYIETSIEAAKILVDKLNPNDRMAIVTDNVVLLQNFTTDKTLLKNRLESLKISALSGEVGRSKQYSALMATLNEMFADQELRPIIIFQTDGDQLNELKGEIGNTIFSILDSINFSHKDILTATEKTRATVYTIIPGINFDEISKREKLEKAKIYLENLEIISARLRNFTLKPNRPKMAMSFIKSRAEWMIRQQEEIAKIAKFTGGWTNYLEQPEQAEKIYAEILSKINERYVIGYYPLNQARDGKIRTLTTEVRGHPEYKIIGRKSYILR